MDIIDRIAERRIEEAMARGELDDLPGTGKPLALDDDALVPAELRMAYRVLKNAGCLPPEVALRREMGSVEALLARSEDDADRARAARRLSMLATRLEACGHRSPLWLERGYHERLVTRLGAPTGSD